MRPVPPDDCAARLSAADLFGRRVEDRQGRLLGTIDSVVRGEGAARAVVLTGGHPRAIFVCLDRALIRDGVVVAVDPELQGRSDGPPSDVDVLMWPLNPQKELQ